MNDYPNYKKQRITNHGAPDRKAGKTDIFTLDEITRLINPELYTDKVLHLYYSCCLLGDLRTGEVRGLRPKQILFDREALIVDGFVKSDGTRVEYHRQGAKINSKFRIVPLPDITLNLLVEHLAEHRVPEDGFVFKGQKEPDKPIAARYAHDNLKRIMKKAGIEPNGRKLTVQSFRLTYIMFIQSLLSANTAMKPAIHRTIRTTGYFNKRLADEPVSGLSGADSAAVNLLS
jgi:integrase